MDVPEIDVDELAGHRDQGAPVLDVREPDEYQEGHVPGARLVPLAEVPDHVGDVAPQEPLYVICKTGGRSLRAAEFLRANGVDAVNVSGGTSAWIDAGLPVATGDAPG